MKTIDRKTLQAITEDVMKAIESVGKKHGVALTKGRGLYSDGATGSIKIEISAIDDSGVVVDKSRALWLEYAKSDILSAVGAQAEWLDKTFEHSGRTFTVIGLSPTRSKYGITCRRDDGKEFGYPSASVKRLMELAVKKQAVKS